MCQILVSAEILQATETTPVFVLDSFYFGGGHKETIQMHSIISCENRYYYYYHYY